MKAEGAGLWKAILAEPDEDAHRLVFADWLDDHGDSERAEFIRVQCELARLPVADPRRVGLEVREAVLLQDHRDKWLVGLAKWMDRVYVTFRRGFPWSVGTNRKVFLRNASALAARTVIQEATLDIVREEGAGIAALPIARRLRSLRTFSSSFAELQELLTACPHLISLALLYPSDDGDVAERLDELLAIPSARMVRQFTIYLRAAEGTARQAVEAIARTEFSNLETLGLDLLSHGRETLEAILRAPYFRGLRSLSLTGRMDSLALERLGETAPTGLRSLKLTLGEGAGAAFAKLAEAPSLSDLVDLSLAGPEAECEAALQSALPPRLRTLRLRPWSRGAEREPVALELAESGRATGLVRLCVTDDQWTDAHTAEFASRACLPALVHLELDKRELTERSLDVLAESHRFPALRAVTALPKLMSGAWLDVTVAREVNARASSRFAVLVPPPAGVFWSPVDLRLGIY